MARSIWVYGTAAVNPTARQHVRHRVAFGLCSPADKPFQPHYRWRAPEYVVGASRSEVTALLPLPSSTRLLRTSRYVKRKQRHATVFLPVAHPFASAWGHLGCSMPPSTLCSALAGCLSPCG